MNLPGLLFLLAIYTLVVAAVVTVAFFIANHRRRRHDSGLAIPIVPGLRMARIDAAGAAWMPRDLAARSKTPAAESTDLKTVVFAPATEPVARLKPARVIHPWVTKPEALGETIEAAAVVPEAAEPVPADAPTFARAQPTASTAKTPAPAAADDEPAVPVASNPFAAVGWETGTLLPEGLRTLEVRPNRSIEPGTAVRAAFTLRNPGGGAASGFRVRFHLPDGLVYAAGTSRIDGSPLDDADGCSPLLLPSGAAVGDIPAGGARSIALEFGVRDAVENGTPIALQAALTAPDVPVIGSNIVRLVVRSRPTLENPKTTLALGAGREVRPGDELELIVRVHNSGQSSAHDVMVMLPLPPHTTLVPHSLTIDASPLADHAQPGTFRLARPTIVTPLLMPGSTTVISCRVRIDTPLEDAVPISAAATVCAREVAEFALTAGDLRVVSAAAFDGPETSFRVDCSNDVQAGERVPIVLTAKNVGTAAARDVSLSIVLPAGMAYVAGSLQIDGSVAPDRGGAPDVLRVGDLAPGRTVAVAIGAIVQSPLADGFALRPAAFIRWSSGERGFERELTVHSSPRFPADFNTIERETPQRVGPGGPVAFTITVANMGTDVARDARLRLDADDGLHDLRVREGDADVPITAGSIALDVLEPGVSRRLRVDGRVAGIIADQTPLRLTATLSAANAEPVALGAPLHIVESFPKFSLATSRLSVDSIEPPRLKRLTTFRLVLANDGTDCAREIRALLLVPDDLRIERVDDATLDGDAVIFGDIPAGQMRAAVLWVRLVGVVAGGDPITIGARITGANVVPLNLTPIELSTQGEAAFAEGAALVTVPSGSISGGAELACALRLHNGGDAAAKSLVAHLTRLTNAVYAQGSTTVNGVALADHGGSSLLLSDAGLQFADVGVGVDVVIGWRVIVTMPLPPGTTIEIAASVRWDAAPPFSIAAAPVAVRSTSALPVIDPELPFSILGAIAAHPLNEPTREC